MRLAGIAAVCFALTTAAGAETLTPDEMRTAALAALAEGDANAALAIADALIGRDPADETALAIRSRAGRDLGRYDSALDDARAAWDAARTDEEKYRAALLRAQALSSQGSRGMAQFWLRRAAQLAPTSAQRRQAVRDFRYVRSQNPLGTRLTVGIAPTDNVNNGTAEAEVDYLGDKRQPIGTSRALSGTRYTIGAELDYRLRRTRNLEDHARFGALHQTYTLSDEAEQILDDVPDTLVVDPVTGEIEVIEGAHGIDGGEFAYSLLRIGLGRQFTPGPGQGLYDVSVDLAKDWYGGDPYSSFVESRAALTARIFGRTTAKLALGGRYLERERGGEESVRRASLGAEVTRGFGKARLTVAAGLATSDSDAEFYDYNEARLGLSYAAGRPVLGALVSFEAEVTATDFGDWPFLLGAPAGDPTRRDVTLRAGIDAVLPALGRYGFAPVLSLEAADRRSTAEIHEFEQIGIGIGIRSVF